MIAARCGDCGSGSTHRMRQQPARQQRSAPCGYVDRQMEQAALIHSVLGPLHTGVEAETSFGGGGGGDGGSIPRSAHASDRALPLPASAREAARLPRGSPESALPARSAARRSLAPPTRLAAGPSAASALHAAYASAAASRARLRLGRALLGCLCASWRYQSAEASKQTRLVSRLAPVGS